jgi:hypothetical protein
VGGSARHANSHLTGELHRTEHDGSQPLHFVPTNVVVPLAGRRPMTHTSLGTCTEPKRLSQNWIRPPASGAQFFYVCMFHLRYIFSSGL